MSRPSFWTICRWHFTWKEIAYLLPRSFTPKQLKKLMASAPPELLKIMRKKQAKR